MLNLRYMLTLLCSLAVLAGCQTEDGNNQDASTVADDNRPNVILVMTDDQGYGDIAALGNPLIQTPNLDALHDESVRFTNFHVDPTCSPTRAALMTGQHSMRAGVWHTVMGRSMLPTEKVTLAEVFSAAGYRTGIFGKWHLGDNYPFRPEDQGFDRVVIHGGGGVGQTPDVWGNTQFDDQYYVDGEPTALPGNSTDVWFDQAEAFLAGAGDQPAFAYVSLNAPHTPYRAPQKYVTPYLESGLPEPMALFYAMITHLDERVGQLNEMVAALPSQRPFIFIFMTDNGSSFRFSPAQMGGDPNVQLARILEGTGDEGWERNAGLRAYKASVYDGGHRVPFFISGTGIEGGRDVAELTAHSDVLPTLVDLAGLHDEKLDIDGTSLAPFIQTADGHPDFDRTIVVTNQRVFTPSLSRPTAVMTDRWRYVSHGEANLTELFDIVADPGQTKNVIADHPDVADQLHAAMEAWWEPYDRDDYGASRIIVGGEAPDTVRLTSMDWMEAAGTNEVPWFPGFDRPPSSGDPDGWIGQEDSFAPLPWYIDVAEAGTYRIEVFFHDKPAGTAAPFQIATLKIGEQTLSTSVSPGAAAGVFQVSLEPGPQSLSAWFGDEAVSKIPAFYVYVTEPGVL